MCVEGDEHMFRIAICDDERQFRKRIHDILIEYMNENDILYEIDEFESGKDFISLGINLAKYDIVFLDVNMDELDGMETAQKIRKVSNDVFIVFITAFITCAPQGYSVGAIRYILKNNVNFPELIFECMDAISLNMNYVAQKKKFNFNEGTKIVALERLLYIESRLHDLYAKDISKKISSSKQEAMEKGIPTGNVAYGYKVVFNENKVKVMVEDKEAADVVRWIFNEAEKGTLHSVIAAELNAKHILTPAQYKVRHNIEKLEKLRGVKWTVDTISRILKNEVYIGRYVTGKDRVCLYRHEKRHTTNKDEWYVFENHHIALIAKEQFYAVQKNKRKVIKPAKNQTVNMLKGKIICGCCGSSIHIHPEKHAKVYLCTHRKRYGKDSCNCLPVKVDDVYAAVLAVIKEQIQVFVDREMILKEHHNDSRVIRQEQVYTEAVNKCVKEMDRLMELKSGLYADYTEELLDEKEYLQLNREYSQRIEKLKIQADEYRQAASQYESAEKTVAQLKAEMLRFKGKRKLTQEMVDLFVAQVRIYENKNLEIVLNYEDELKKFAELNMEREAG